MFNYLRKLLLMVTILLVPWVGQSQELGDYQLTVDTTTFTSIVSTGSSVSFSSTDDGYGSVNLPFDFPFGESLVTSGSSLCVGSNGYLFLTGTYSSTTATWTGTEYRVINPILGQDGHIGRYSTSGAYYQLDTTDDGVQCLTIEYHLLSLFSSPYGVYSNQVKLYENGNIEIVFDSVNLDGYSNPTLRTFFWDGPNNDLLYFSGPWANPSLTSTATTRPTSALPVHGLRYTLSRPVLTCPKPRNITFANLSTSSVDVHWTEVGDATSWTVEYDTVLFVPGTTGNAFTVTEDSVSLTDLEPGATYYFAIHSECGGGDTSFNLLGQVTIPSAEPVSEYPWTCNFRGEVALGWELLNDGQTNQWHIGAAAGYEGAGDSALYISNDNGVSHSYTITTPSNSYATRTLNMEAGQYGIQFDYRSYGESCCDYMYAFLIPADQTPTPGILSTSGTGWITLMSQTNMVSSWQTNQSVIVIPAAGSYKLTFLWHNDGSVGTDPPAAIDNILVTQISCPQPTQVVCTTAVDTLSFSWQPGGTETSWLCVLNGDTTQVATTTIVYPDLNPASPYTFCVAAVCEDTSFFTCGTYRTDCSEFIVLPYFENFEGYEQNAVPQCWETGGYSPYPYVSTYGGSNALYGYLYESGGSNSALYMSLPGVDTLDNPVNTLQLYFDAMKTTSSSGISYSFDIEVGVCGVQGDMSTFVPVDTVRSIPYNNNSMTSYEVSLSRYSDTGRFVTLRVRASSPTSYAYVYVALDNVMLAPAPTCQRVLDLHLDYATHDSVYLSWRDTNSIANGFYVEYGPHGFAHGSENSTVVYVSDTTVAIGGLDADTYYDFYVATDCGSDDTSYWRDLTIHTDCIPIDSLPFVYGFESQFNSCWTKGSSYDIAYPQIIGSGCLSPYSLNMYNYAYDGDHCFAAMPPFNHQLDSLQVKFRIRRNSSYSYSYYGFSIQVGVMTNPNDISTFEPVGVYEASSYTDWDTVTCFLSDYHGNGRYIAFKDNGDGTRYYTYVLIDDIEIDYLPNCGSVENVEVVTTPYNALITWTPSSVGEYNGAQVGIQDTATGNWTYYTVSGTDVTIHGLTPETYYNYVIVGTCSEDDAIPIGGGFLTAILRCGSMVEGTGDTVVVGTGSSQTTGVPVTSAWGNSFCQSIFTAAELNALGIDSGTFNGIDYTWTNNSSYSKEFTIFMGTTSQSTANGTTPISPATHIQVYHGDHVLGTSGTVHYDFDAPFNWNGTDNLVITTFMNQPTGASHSSSSFYGLSTDCGTDRTVYGYQDGTQFTTTAYSSGYFNSSSYRPTITLYSGICESLETCVAPNPMVTSTTPTSATLHWAPGNEETNWSVYYAPNGSTHFTYAGTATTNTFTVNGLQQGTNYQFQVTALCGDDSNSAFCDGITQCAMITSFPYFEDFNNWPTNSIPNCWNRDGSYSTYPYISTGYNASGSGGSVYFYLYNNGSNYCRLTAPEVDTTAMPIRNLQLYFQALQSYSGYNNDIEIGVMVDPYNMSTFRPIDTVSLVGTNTGQWYDFEVPLDSYTLPADTGTFITLRAITTSSYTYSYVDDFTIEPIPSCQRPDSLVLDSVSETSFTCHWHDRSGSSQWIVEWGPRGFTPGTGNMVPVTSNPVTITGVPTSFNGDFYVYSVCSVGDTSPASRHCCLFDTRQVPATLPYHYNFEDSTEWANWQTNSNHPTANWYRGTAQVYDSNYAMYISNDGGLTFGTDNNAIVNAAVYRDIDFGSVDSSYEMTFRYWVGGDREGRYDGLMAFLVDPGQPVVASTAAITTPWGSVNELYRIADARRDTNWAEYRASFDTISGVHRVAFFWLNQSRAAYFDWGPAAIDDIHIDYSPCPRPLNLDTTNLTSVTASLHWDGPTVAQYRVAYRVYGNAPSTNQFVTCSTNSITLRGLSPMTEYVAWVQKICGDDTSIFSDGIRFQTRLCENSTYAYNFPRPGSYSTTNYFPGYATYNYSFSEVIIDSADLAASGLTADMPISAFMYNPTTTTANTYHTNCDIYMANTSLDNLNSDFIPIDSTFVQVASALDLSFTDVGWQVRGFDSAFTWDGHSNVVFAVHRQHGTWTSATSFESHSGRSGQGRYIYQDSGPYSVTSISGGYTTDNVANYVFISCGPSGPTCNEPTVTSVTHDYHSATVTWTGDGTDYEVNIKESSALDWPATDIPVTGTSYTFTGLLPETDYIFRLRQHCVEDSAYSDWVISGFTTDDLPCFAPDSLTVSGLTNAQGTFSWNPVGNETHWDIHVWFTGGLDSIYRVASNPVTVGGYTAGVTYNATIRAVCGDELLEGDWGDTIQFTTATCPDVTGLSTSGVTENSVTLNWTADPMAQSWLIEYGFQGFAQGTGTSVTTTTNSYIATGLDDETAYDFYVKAVCGTDWNSEGWTHVSATTLEAEDPTYTVTVSASDPSMGTVSGGGTYRAGETCTVTATPNAGFQFVNWSNGETANPYSFTVVSNITLQAIFAPLEGIDDINGGAACSIYPNPTSSSTTISVEGVSGEVRISVVDMSGRTVRTETLECSGDCQKTMEVEGLAQGTYFVRITADAVNLVRKLVVR